MLHLKNTQHCHLAFTLICTLWFCGCDHSAKKHEAGSVVSPASAQSDAESLPKENFGEIFTNWDDWDREDATQETLLTMSDEEKKQLKKLGLRYEFTDRAMQAIQGLENIEKLSLGDNRLMTEKGMLLIGTLPNLKSLTYSAPNHNPPRSVWDEPILTIKVFHELANLKRLEGISIFSRLINDDCLEPLHRLPNLERVCVNRMPKLTEKSLKHLSKIKSLTRLQFDAENWNGEGLEFFIDHPNLTTLILSDSDIDDTGMALVAQLSNLESLDIHDTAVTKASLVHIKKLTKLKKLRTTQTVDAHVFSEYMQQKKLADEAAE